jgi:S-DNA-T family DNA segregation ATPase FtsK/SpoIIIE
VLSPSTGVGRRTSRCWTIVGPDAAADVEVLARDDEHLAAVLPHLGSVLGTPGAGAFIGSTRLPDTVRLSDLRLRHGAVLGIDRPARSGATPAAAAALELHVVGGPDAGRTVALASGDHLVGRDTGSVVPLGDPDVSRRHVALHVGGGSVEVADLGSSNGTRLDGRHLAANRPLAWRPGDRLRIGATTLEVAGPGDAPAASSGGVGGRTVLRPSVRIATGRTPVEVSFPPRPAPPPARRLAWVAVALPAVGGVALAIALRAPTFLFFALLSPLVAVASWWSDRRSGGRAHRRALAEFEVLTAEAEARLAEALTADVRAAHRRLPDLAALASAGRRRTSLIWSRGTSDPDLLTIRVGSGPGITGVVRHGTDGVRAPVRVEDTPVGVDLRAHGLAVTGPRSRSLGVLRAAIGQLAALHPPDTVELLLVTSAARLPDWRWARWLPHLRSDVLGTADGPAESAVEDGLNRSLLALLERRRTLVPSGPARPWPGPWTVVVVDGSLPAPAAAALSRARDVGVTVLTHGETLDQVQVPVDAELRVTGDLGTHGTLHMRGTPSQAGVALDQLPLDVAAALARDLAGLTPATDRSALPTTVRFLDVAAPGAVLTEDSNGAWTRDRGSLRVAVGVGADGVERLDLCRHGPHALVAGTTGAGKSELLQTLIAGLALTHPPDRCSFLLVDYKGGAAFAEAAHLPHTVGLLTDLDEASTARALRSLDAEITRRETLLAAHSVADISALPDEVAMARLVIAVDEFATLAEELPGFVPGLVAIAQRGRSLGIHLVLATQRPAGVVSADIRANCTLRICLRTTDETDSRDVLGGPEAAHLPLEIPGRAYVRTGSGPARLLQVARVSQPGSSGGAEPLVAPWCWPTRPSPPDRPTGDDTDLARVVRHLDARARALAIATPHRPWRAPLPADVSLEEAESLAGGAVRSPAELLLGLVDRPDRQDRRPLLLDLSVGGGWLAVGGPRSGRTTLLRSVLRQAVAARPVDQLHVHVIDLGGGALAAEAATLPHAGTVIPGRDALRAVRLVHRLTDAVAGRRSARTADEPDVLLLVDGVEALSELLDDADPAHGSGDLLRLIRNGGSAGLTCVLTADRAIPGGRLAGAVGQRLVLPLPDRADYAVAGVPLASVPSSRPPGRALVGEDLEECQLVLPPPLRPAPRRSGRRTHRHEAPLSIPELDPDPLIDPHVAEDTRRGLQVPLGPGGDEGRLLSVELLRTGGLLVIGPPGSGRTTTLDAVVADLASAGVPVLRLGGLPRTATSAGSGPVVADITDTPAVSTWLTERCDRPVAICVDDLGPAGSAPALGALTQLGSTTGVVLLAAGSGGDVSTWFQGPVAALRRARNGVLLRPGPGDADVLGVRLPRTPVPSRPGSGWLVLGGVAERVQVARRRVRPARPAVGQSSSSTGPISCVAYQASS